MLSGNDIVYVSNDWFTENKTSSHQIAERLASRGNRILYVEAAGLRKPRASKRDIKKIIRKLGKGLSPPRAVTENVYVYSPLIIPFHGIKLFRKFNQLLSILSVKWACKKIGIKNPLLWIVLPHFYYLAGALNEKGVVYYCVDEYSTLPNADATVIKSFETTLMRKANVVFAVSTELVKSKKLINKNTYHSPHGVDIDHFRKASDEGTLIPEDIIRIPRPIIGFFGLIENWVDLDLIKYLAYARPESSVVLIGKVVQNVSELETCKNVHVLGWRDYRSLPGYLKAFDAAIIPFKVNELIINSNPLKLKEYLAGGKPVATVRIPATEDYADWAYVADTYDEFLKGVDMALAENDPKRIDDRILAMAAESWEARVENISQTVYKHIPGVLNG